jgi:hypothetical protein
MAVVSIPFSGSYAVGGYTPSGHQLKHEVAIGGLKAVNPVVKFTKLTAFTVGTGSVSGTITIDTSELKNLAFPGQNNLTAQYSCFQVDANGSLVSNGATAAASVSFIVQVIDYGDVNVQITSPTSGQVFTVTI